MVEDTPEEPSTTPMREPYQSGEYGEATWSRPTGVYQSGSSGQAKPTPGHKVYNPTSAKQIIEDAKKVQDTQRQLYEKGLREKEAQSLLELQKKIARKSLQAQRIERRIALENTVILREKIKQEISPKNLGPRKTPTPPPEPSPNDYNPQIPKSPQETIDYVPPPRWVFRETQFSTNREPKTFKDNLSQGLRIATTGTPLESPYNIIFADTSKASILTATPVLLGVAKGVRNVALGVGTIAVVSEIPVVGGAIATGLGASWVIETGKDIYSGGYIANPEKQAQLVTELVGFGVAGAKGEKVKASIKETIKEKWYQRKWKEFEDRITDKSFTWKLTETIDPRPARSGEAKNPIIDLDRGIYQDTVYDFPRASFEVGEIKVNFESKRIKTDEIQTQFKYKEIKTEAEVMRETASKEIKEGIEKRQRQAQINKEQVHLDEYKVFRGYMEPIPYKHIIPKKGRADLMFKDELKTRIFKEGNYIEIEREFPETMFSGMIDKPSTQQKINFYQPKEFESIGKLSPTFQKLDAFSTKEGKVRADLWDELGKLNRNPELEPIAKMSKEIKGLETEYNKKGPKGLKEKLKSILKDKKATLRPKETIFDKRGTEIESGKGLIQEFDKRTRITFKDKFDGRKEPIDRPPEPRNQYTQEAKGMFMLKDKKVTLRPQEFDKRGTELNSRGGLVQEFAERPKTIFKDRDVTLRPQETIFDKRGTELDSRGGLVQESEYFNLVWKTGSKSSPVLETIEKNPINERLKPISIIEKIEREKIGIRGKIAYREDVKEREKIAEKIDYREDVKEREKIGTFPDIKSELDLRTMPDQIERLRDKIDQKIDEVQELKDPEEITEESKPKVGMYLPDKDRKTTNTVKGYIAEVRRQGRWQTASKRLPKNDAVKIAKKITDDTPAVSFRVRESGKVAKTKTKRVDLSHYKKKGNVYIEKNKYRIDSPGELAGITRKGIQANKRGGKRWAL